MNKITKILKDAAAIVGVLGVLAGIAYKAFDLDKRSFSTMENRVEAETYFDDKPSAEQEQRALILDSVNKMDAIRSRAKRDSMLREVLERQKRQDSINLLNADQMFQIKEELRKEGLR